MPQSRRYLLISLCILLAIALAWFFMRSTTPVVPEAIKHGYSDALTKTRAGQPGRRGFFISNWVALICQSNSASGCLQNCRITQAPKP